MIYDFHSHVLPLMDDGAKSVEMSLTMLGESVKQGVDGVVATSHCYPNSEKSIEKYLSGRRSSLAMISEAEGLPKLYMGCEVHLTGDLSRFSNIKKLCIENTSYMLLEMPTSKWTDVTIDNVYKLTLLGIKPIIAHDERNMHQDTRLRNSLYELDVLIQINAPSLMLREYRRDIDRLFKMGMAHVIGTDMHNLTTRKPCMEEARKIVVRRYGEKCWEYLMRNAERVISGVEIPYSDFIKFKKKGIF